MKYKAGDRVKYSHTNFWNKRGTGIFIKYNRYNDNLVYISTVFPVNNINNCVCCRVDCVELLPRKGQQLVFDFMK